MKNFVPAVLVIAIGALVLQQILPWWSIALVAFIVSYFLPQNSWQAFASGFVAVFILWVAYAFVLSKSNNHILAHRVASLLPLRGHVSFLLLATGLIGGFVSG